MKNCDKVEIKEVGVPRFWIPGDNEDWKKPAPCVWEHERVTNQKATFDIKRQTTILLLHDS